MRIRIVMVALALLAAVGFAVFTAPEAEAQERWSLELQTGAAFPTDDLGPAELQTGFGFEGTVGFRLIPHLWAYGGWDWHRFSSDEGFSGFESDFEETGYAYGLRWEHPFSSSNEDGIAYRVRAGGTYNHIEVEDEDGDLVADSEHGAGWEAGFGVTIPITEGWRVAPEVRYRALSPEFDEAGLDQDVDLAYLATEIAIIWRF